MSVRTRDWLKFVALVGFAFVLGLAFASALDLRGHGNAAQAALLQQPATLVIRKHGTSQRVPLTLRIDTPIEVDYYRHGGILPFVLRQLLAA